MALVFEIVPYVLKFKFEARTSRGRLTEHKTWFIKVWDDANPRVVGFGESAPFEGLSIDDIADFDDKLYRNMRRLEGALMPSSLEQIENYVNMTDERLPSVRFGLETALRDLYFGGKQMIFDTPFFNGDKAIDINGLVWMGEKDVMLEHLELKVMAGYECVKLKIGALDIEDELDIIRSAREMLGNNSLTIRVDANGAYTENQARLILKELAKYNVQSIEQPVKAGQHDAMQRLCKNTPVPVGLDEDLIGICDLADKRALLENIKPQYIILKPTLLGGFKATQEWITVAEEQGIGWWITSALESNIGLNAICQFTSQYNTKIPQGLGTGDLYVNNIPSPLTIDNGCIFWDQKKHWYLKLAERQA